MDRETIKDCYKAMDKIEKALGGLPYRDAVPAIATLGELRDTIGEGLPGGFFGHCDICNGILGCGDNFASTDDGEWVCTTCCHEAQEITHD
jgi:hypothetical protein